MARSQSKSVIFATSKHRKKPIKLFFLLLIFVLTSFITVQVFPQGISLAETSHEISSAASDTALFTLSPLVSPTPTPVFSPFTPLNSLTSPIASETATKATEIQKEPSDFCLDIPILLYHHVQPLSVATLLGHAVLTVDSTIFDEQMKYLKDHDYYAISADELVTALVTETKLPPKTILITIDDGYDDNYTYAFVTAKKYQMIMNFMIPTALINKPGYMTWDHLKDMQLNKYARIYNHTATHAPVGLLSRQQVEAELASSGAAFQEQLGLDVDIFTYPYGSYNDQAIQILKEQHFKAAFTTIEGTQQCKSRLYELQRSHIGNAPLSLYGL